MDAVMLWMGNDPAATGRYEAMPGRPEVGQPGIPDPWALEKVARARARDFVLEEPWRQVDLVLRRASYLFAAPKRDLIYVYGQGWTGERPPAAIVARGERAPAALPFRALRTSLFGAPWWPPRPRRLPG